LIAGESAVGQQLKVLDCRTLQTCVELSYISFVELVTDEAAVCGTVKCESCGCTTCGRGLTTSAMLTAASSPTGTVVISMKSHSLQSVIAGSLWSRWTHADSSSVPPSDGRTPGEDRWLSARFGPATSRPRSVAFDTRGGGGGGVCDAAGGMKQ